MHFSVSKPWLAVGLLCKPAHIKGTFAFKTWCSMNRRVYMQAKSIFPDRERTVIRPCYSPCDCRLVEDDRSMRLFKWIFGLV